MNELVAPIIRRAILDLLFDVGGELNDDVLTMLLNQLNHGVARRDVAAQMRWLGENGFAKVEDLDPYVTAEILPDGIDAAEGRLRHSGINRHKSGRRAGTSR